MADRLIVTGDIIMRGYELSQIAHSPSGVVCLGAVGGA